MKSVLIRGTFVATVVALTACGTGPIDPKYVDKGTPENPRKCKMVVPIGTKIGQRVCMLQSDWDELAGNAGQGVSEAQVRANQAGNSVLQD